MRPAVAVALVGGAGVVLGASQFIDWLVKTLGHQPTHANAELSLVAAACGLAAVMGGVSMARMKSYALALTGSAAALVASAALIRPTFAVLAVAVGIWALAVLLSATGQAAFGFAVDADRLAAAQEPRCQVRGPAIALLAMGLLDCFGGTMFMWFNNPFLHQGQEVPFRRYLDEELAVGVIAWVPGAILLVAALRMMRLRGYRLVLAGGILAMMPIPPMFLVGLPVGLWALGVLRRPEVKAAFAAAGKPPHESGPEQADAEER